MNGNSKWLKGPPVVLQLSVVREGPSGSVWCREEQKEAEWGGVHTQSERWAMTKRDSSFHLPATCFRPPHLWESAVLCVVCASVCAHACAWKGKAWALMCLNRTNWTLKWKHARMESVTMTSVSECRTVYFFLMSAGLHFPSYLPITSPAGAPCPTGPRGLSGTRGLRMCSTGHQHCCMRSAKCVCECEGACCGGSMSLKKIKTVLQKESK